MAVDWESKLITLYELNSIRNSFGSTTSALDNNEGIKLYILELRRLGTLLFVNGE
ncbi:hypothetical protein Nhal_3772 [Nitrosococcus halophilus Nc 4]|uniref:Uncharacterized protein n=1 Tax=Nitrosococcus halophilus (strain Nc4) TaxID=472759 RepID=D5C2W3_NITHN|nr:hypothetical protein Nhal_3772 [Nitrosococcus halophilus Nc 4]